MNEIKGKDLNLTGGGFVAFLFAFLAVEFFYISPLYFIKKYERGLITLGEVPFLQLFCIVLNCLSYIIFAVKGEGDLQNLITNCIGLILSVLVMFRLFYVIKKNITDYFYLFIILNVIFQIFYFVFRSNNARELSSFVSQLMNVSMYLVLNQNDLIAWNTKDPSKIPILSAVIGLVASVGWTLFAKLTKESREDLSRTFEVTSFSNGASVFVLLIPITEYLVLKYSFKKKGGKRTKTGEHNIKNQDDLEANKIQDDKKEPLAESEEKNEPIIPEKEKDNINVNE